MVPLFYHPDIALGKKVLKACYDGGARLMEFTARGDFAFEVFSELNNRATHLNLKVLITRYTSLSIKCRENLCNRLYLLIAQKIRNIAMRPKWVALLNKYALKELPGMVMGVGSITDAGAASLFTQMGANFIVTPSLREDIAILCNRRKVLWSPGCGSLTEINKAEELGCEIVKLFPGDIYGPGFVKGIKGPQPWTSVMPTGGVSTDEENLKAWFEAGVTCVGVGSKLISKEILANEDFVGLETLVRETLGRITKLKD